MSKQFISSVALADTLHNASGVVVSWDSDHYDRVANPKHDNTPSHSIKRGSQLATKKNGERRDMAYPDLLENKVGLPGSKERIDYLAGFYAEWAGQFDNDEFERSPFREELPSKFDTTPANLGFFRGGSDWFDDDSFERLADMSQ